MNRRDILVAGIDLHRASGLEIGALCSPLVTRAEGRIHYVDYADTAFLRQRYADDPAVDTDAIVDVDFVWGERSLTELADGKRFDYIVASHVIEHVPDLVTWLNELSSVLAPGGTIRLAIPDRRFTFDLLRQESVLADVVDAHIRKARRPLPRVVFDSVAGIATVDGAAAWRGQVDLDTVERQHRFDQALALARRVFETDEYHDVHCWVFTPRSFARLLGELSAARLIDLACDTLTPTQPDTLEFFVTLRLGHGESDLAQSWQDAAVSAATAIEPGEARPGHAATASPNPPTGDDAGAGLERELAEVREALADVLNSTSWKITAPMRRSVERLRWVNRIVDATRTSMRHRGGFGPMLRAQVRAARDQGLKTRWAQIHQQLLADRSTPVQPGTRLAP